MNRIFTAALKTVSIAILSLGVAATASLAQKKSYTFKGKVEAVKEASKSLTVNGETVTGWMDAMTMDYKVEDPAILKKVKVGDTIAATVYDGDMVLHDVKVTGKKDSDKSKMAK
jgi:protein SCO1/2